MTKASSLTFYFFLLDVNECSLNKNVCHAHGECNNTIGSFQCRCQSGYTGDGFNCTGQQSHECCHADCSF